MAIAMPTGDLLTAFALQEQDKIFISKEECEMNLVKSVGEHSSLQIINSYAGEPAKVVTGNFFDQPENKGISGDKKKVKYVSQCVEIFDK